MKNGEIEDLFARMTEFARSIKCNMRQRDRLRHDPRLERVDSLPESEETISLNEPQQTHYLAVEAMNSLQTSISPTQATMSTSVSPMSPMQAIMSSSMSPMSPMHPAMFQMSPMQANGYPFSPMQANGYPFSPMQGNTNTFPASPMQANMYPPRPLRHASSPMRPFPSPATGVPSVSGTRADPETQEEDNVDSLLDPTIDIDDAILVYSATPLQTGTDNCAFNRKLPSEAIREMQPTQRLLLFCMCSMG